MKSIGIYAFQKKANSSGVRLTPDNNLKHTQNQSWMNLNRSFLNDSNAERLHCLPYNAHFILYNILFSNKKSIWTNLKLKDHKALGSVHALLCFDLIFLNGKLWKPALEVLSFYIPKISVACI